MAVTSTQPNLVTYSSCNWCFTFLNFGSPGMSHGSVLRDRIITCHMYKLLNIAMFEFQLKSSLSHEGMSRKMSETFETFEIVDVNYQTM